MIQRPRRSLAPPLGVGAVLLAGLAPGAFATDRIDPLNGLAPTRRAGPLPLVKFVLAGGLIGPFPMMAHGQAPLELRQNKNIAGFGPDSS